jgi:hypothetical protein
MIQPFTTQLTSLTHLTQLLNLDGFKLARLKTHAALDTFRFVNLERNSFLLFGLRLTGNRLNRTSLRTPSAQGTDIGKDSVGE